MIVSTNKSILNHYINYSDYELYEEYHSLLLESLNDLSEEMYQLGYDIVDIEEYEENQNLLSKKLNVIEKLCNEREIKLF